ncbi:PepSY domain-containing protein [Pseudomonas sp. R5(2019)]|uniref:PepSY-associated TM helix domain-containing protein n=1 Tax=Pseudomonas sp. R5(2019) TaxID=2697566 RepID=UPI0014120A5E|nr:PepSY-associated TM helix domain-containing protein [Pseudomonas sp. R5(2019)]NBA95034.1 PepSY domain-containing protein [Pseudomonas sp. R5(2019)]
MREGFRQAMAWLHTWAGLVFGWLLFAIFLTGSLAYFKNEINHWAQPEVPFHRVDAAVSLATAQSYLQKNAADAASWYIQLPDARQPAMTLAWPPTEPDGGGRRRFINKQVDPVSGEALLVLPFHLMISYSSLVIFMHMVMPASILATYGTDTRGFFDDVFPRAEIPRAAGTLAPQMPLPVLHEKALQQLQSERVGSVEVDNPGDANARVSFSPSASGQIARRSNDSVVYDGVSGELTNTPAPDKTPIVIADSLYGLHMGHFAGAGLRWLYFLCGLAATAVIGTGLVMWLSKRQLKHAKSGVRPLELRLVEVLNIASMSGLVLAVAVFFWANRLLPVQLATRADVEIQAFFLTWTLALIHAVLRPGRQAWVEQLGLAALLLAGLPLLNILTTYAGLTHSLASGDWIMAGFDLTALGCGLFLAWAAWKVRRGGTPALRAARHSSARLIEEEAA